MPETGRERHAQDRGVLILIVGPSGAGKDTLIDAARTHFSGNGKVLFWRRCITRLDQTGEPHEYIQDDDFARMQEEGAFFLSWTAHDLHYGIAGDVPDKLTQGNAIIINTSRQVIDNARTKWPDTHVISITARPEILRKRLEARGRENPAAIAARLQRSNSVSLPKHEKWFHEIDNSGTAASGAKQLVTLITQIINASRVHALQA